MQKYCSPTGDAESPSVRNFIANYKEECFVCLIKKWSCWKKINIENYFLVGLSAIYLLKSVLHLKYEKITVINNMQFLRYIDTVAIRTRPVHRCVFAMTYRIKSLLEIYMKFLVSWNFWSTNFHESASLFNHCYIVMERISVAKKRKKRKKNSMGKIENRSRGVESIVRSLITLPQRSNSLLGGIWFSSHHNNRNPNLRS